MILIMCGVDTSQGICYSPFNMNESMHDSTYNVEHIDMFVNQFCGSTSKSVIVYATNDLSLC